MNILWRLMGLFIAGAVGFVAIVIGAGLLVLLTREDPVLRRRWQLLDMVAHNPAGFERFVESVLRGNGYRPLRGPKKGPDGGIDLVMTGPDGQSVIVQCKNWLRWRIDVETVRAVYGVLAQQGAGRALIVTSGTFSSAARAFARATPADRPIQLIDGKELLRLSNRARSAQLQKRRAASRRVLAALEVVDRYWPLGRLVDWTDFQFQHRPLWVPVGVALVGGAALEVSLRMPAVAGEWIVVFLLAGISARGWRWWQGRRLEQIRTVADIRADTMTRGRLEYLVMEACQRQGFKVREFKPKGQELWSLEVIDGSTRTLVQVLPPDQTRLQVEDVTAAHQLGRTHRFDQTAIVTTGVASAPALTVAAASGLEVLDGRALADFLVAMAHARTQAVPSLVRS